MVRKLFVGLGMLICIVVISELIGLAYLYYGLKSYPNYWHGRANQPGEFVYVALGDSAAQAVGASRPENGYVGLLADSIEQATGRRVRLINLSRSGAKVGDALNEQIPKLNQYTPDLVTAEIGANDMRAYNPEVFQRQYEQFLQSLPPGVSIVSNMPYFGGRADASRNARDANQIISQLTSRYGIPTADLYGALSRQQSPFIYASDLFHPNDRGYRIWYQAFRRLVVLQAIKSPLTPPKSID
jgi:acyl-CoA thioesterase I